MTEPPQRPIYRSTALALLSTSHVAIVFLGRDRWKVDSILKRSSDRRYLREVFPLHSTIPVLLFSQSQKTVIVFILQRVSIQRVVANTTSYGILHQQGASANMAHANRIEQLEDLRNITTNADFYDKLAAGKITSVGSNSPNGAGQPYYIPVPITLKAQLGSPTALAIGAFATTLTTLSFALMGWRGVSTTNAFIGDFFGVAGIGMLITAQWEIVLGNTYAYTVLSAFGLFYAGFGFIITPSFGVAAAYGGADSAEYNNAVGFFVLSMFVRLRWQLAFACKQINEIRMVADMLRTVWAVFNLFFLIGSLPLNLVYIGIFFTVQLAFTLVAASYFLTADGKASQAAGVKIAAGAFAFVSGLLGYYTVGKSDEEDDSCIKHRLIMRFLSRQSHVSRGSWI